ncbi:uncharacterized protein FA14DRAFT_60836 [Meira miltonrushii]|uniref:Uncharacterized protein n=1 Tax=Meira miltonrushii TaxID=1280837 RepID=A0A316V701_9BASI|nr:uncharacterized protein FA14DRAFT_60836 [Meira miltonrushii]PWN33306.1 hypothetical protein FA14DRAFT_60836 [Meira miltonrushii]
MRTPLQGFGQLQRVYGGGKGSHLLPSFRGYWRGLRSINHQPNTFPQAKGRWESGTCNPSHHFYRSYSSITGQIDENLLYQNEASTSDIPIFLPDSIDALRQMQLEDLTKYIANLHLKGKVKQRVDSFEDVFALFNKEQSSALQELVKSKIDSSEIQLNAFAWSCYINILAHCKSWEDVMIELHAMIGAQLQNPESSLRPDIPVFVMEHAFGLIRNSHHASEACSLLNENLDSFNSESAIILHLSLNDLIMNDLQATYLSGSLTSITIRIADSLVRTNSVSIDGQIEALKIIRHLVQSFLPWPFGHIRRHVQRLLKWADSNLSLDHSDILRMQILGCEAADGDIKLPWQQIRWTPSAQRSFPTSDAALDLIDRLYDNKRHGAGLQFALSSALYIMTRSRSERQAIELVGKAERLYKSNRIAIDFFKSIAFLQELVMFGQKEKALQLFGIILTTNEEVGHFTKIKVWASIVGMLANMEDSPDIAMRILDQASPKTIPIPRPPEEVLSKPFIYAKVMQQIALREDSDCSDLIGDVWDLMLSRGIRPDLHCLEEYCVALVSQGRTTEALNALNQWPVKLEESRDSDCKPRPGFVYRMMKRMIEQGETQQVYHLYQEYTSKWQQDSDIILLPTLLRAAEEVSAKRKEMGYSEDHPFIARMLFQRKDPLKSKEILWDGIPAPLRARQIFRQTLFDNHPDLFDLPNPLDDPRIGKRGALWRNEIRMQKFEDWLSQKLSFEGGSGQKERFASLMHAKEDQDIKDQLKTNHENDSVQRIMLQCTHDLFENYLRLLPYVEDCAREIGIGSREREHLHIGWDERLMVISWMRYLDIFPNKSCLCLICAYIQEKMPPVFEGSNLFASRNVDPYSDSKHSAAGPLHGFLADWIGEENIPTNQDVANSIRT